MPSQALARYHRLPGSLFRRHVYRAKKSNGDFIIELDENAMQMYLDAQGISREYQQKAASILKDSAEDITTQLRFKVGPGYFQGITVPRAAYYYVLGISCFHNAVYLWMWTEKKAGEKADKKAE